LTANDYLFLASVLIVFNYINMSRSRSSIGQGQVVYDTDWC